MLELEVGSLWRSIQITQRVTPQIPLLDNDVARLQVSERSAVTDAADSATMCLESFSAAQALQYLFVTATLSHH